MNPIDKLIIIDTTWLYLDSERYITDKEKERASYYFDSCSNEKRAEYLFYKMIFSFKNKNHVKDLIQTLDINNTFEIINLEADRQCLVKFKDEYLDYRLDLKAHSPMGFGNGGSSHKQMSLAILAKATNNKEALRYYEDFDKHIDSMYDKSILKDKRTLSQLDIIYWLSEQILSNPVKRICKILDLKQKELAEQLHVSDVSVNRWSSKSIDVPAPMLRTFDILEENHILKNKVNKVDLILRTLAELRISY